MEKETDIDLQLAKRFTNVVNTHGYGFHYSVLKKAIELAQAKKSLFSFVASEFPVAVNGKDTRIDFILERIEAQTRIPIRFYLISECKRVNPSYSDWLFFKSPFFSPSRKMYEQNSFFEAILYDSNRTDFFSYTIRSTEFANSFHLGLEVKGDKKGDDNAAKGSMGEAIELGSAQVLRGVNGFIETLFRSKQLLSSTFHYLFIPVIFTTANLYVANVNLAEAELISGELDIPPENLERVDWLSYQYPMSFNLKHTNALNTASTIDGFLFKEHIRTIFVVNPIGIEKFLHTISQTEFEQNAIM